MEKLTKFCIVITTCQNEKEAITLGQKILKKKLGACIQLSKIESFYLWDKNIENEQEIRVIIKTKKSLYNDLENFLEKNHPYQIPQIIMLPIEKGSKSYFNWMNNALN